MKSVRLPSGATLFGQEYNALRSDASGGSFLKAHQQLGAFAMGTNPTDGQTITFIVNGSNVVLTGKTGTLSNPGDFAIQATPEATLAVIYAALHNPTTTTSTFIGFTGTQEASAVLLQYAGYALPAGGTTLTAYSLNNSVCSPLTSFSMSATVTGATWTAQTMQLYVEPGTCFIGSTRVLFLGGSSPTVTAPSANPRIDLLTINASGSLAWTQGTENASPTAPAYPVAQLPICELYNVVGETALYDNDNQQSGQGYIFNDVRPALSVLASPYPPTGNGTGSFSAAGTITIPHGLGRIPNLVRIAANYQSSNETSIGTYNGTTANCIQLGAALPPSSGYIISLSTNCTATITMDATNIYLTVSFGVGSTFSVNYLWEAQ